MIPPKDARSRALTLALLPVGIILILWNACQLARWQRPMKIGADAWIGRQIGRTARNHLILGLATTKGTNVAAIRNDGSLEIHRAYSPLASWTVALPMAAGLSFDDSIRLPVLLSLNAFLVGLWSFARGRWGDRVAALALLCAAFSPILLFKYGITCIFEILALGPLMVAVALFAQPVRGPKVWAGLVALSVASVMYSWICWLVVIPCVLREAFKGHRTGAACVGLSSVAVPVLVHFATMALASGDLSGDIVNFFFHIGERLSDRDRQGRPVITYAVIVRLLALRWLRDIGAIPLACTAICLVAAVVPRFRVDGWPWVALLFAFALPLNLARNIALHDFFVILFVPVAALSAGLVIGTAVSRLRRVPAQAWATGLVLAVFLGLDVLPKRRMMTLTPASYRQATIADEIGRVVAKDDFVIVNAEVVGLTDGFNIPEGLREMSPRPYYCGQMAQTVFVASDGLDATRLAARARPGQRVVILEVGDRPWDLPRHFSRIETKAKPLLIGVRPDLLARSR
jgi:hypothetical protein